MGLAPDNLESIPLTHTDNDFVENHPRFAKRNDVVSYRRIVGEIRFALYNLANLSLRSSLDYQVEYGLAFVPGTYDNAGVWTPTNELPDPRETGDEDDKWLFKNRAILSFGAQICQRYNAATGDLLVETGGGDVVYRSPTDALTNEAIIEFTQRSRPSMMSTDEQMPLGSKVDIKTHRRSEYGEKLYILAFVTTEAEDTEQVLINCDYQLRVLVNG